MYFPRARAWRPSRSGIGRPTSGRRLGLCPTLSVLTDAEARNAHPSPARLLRCGRGSAGLGAVLTLYAALAPGRGTPPLRTRSNLLAPFSDREQADDLERRFRSPGQG